MPTDHKPIIREILAELVASDVDIDQVNNLVSGAYLDSFAVLMLISNLESRFAIEIDFDLDVYEYLESVASIERLVNKHNTEKMERVS